MKAAFAFLTTREGTELRLKHCQSSLISLVSTGERLLEIVLPRVRFDVTLELGEYPYVFLAEQEHHERLRQLR